MFSNSLPRFLPPPASPSHIPFVAVRQAEETPAETQHYSNELIKLFNDAQIANEDNVELPSYAPMPEKQQEKHKNEAAGVVYEKLEGGPDAHKQRSSIPIYEATPGRE